MFSGYWPVSDDFRHVGREDHLLVRWTQRNEKVSIIIHDLSCNRLNPTILSFNVVHTETLEAGLFRNPDLVELTNELAFSDYRWQVVQITGENTQQSFLLFHISQWTFPVYITVHAFFLKKSHCKGEKSQWVISPFCTKKILTCTCLSNHGIDIQPILLIDLNLSDSWHLCKKVTTTNICCG